MKFEIAAPGRILFGEGRVAEVGTLARELGERAMVVEGTSGRAGSVVELLTRGGVATTRFTVAGEPATRDVERGVELARAESCDLVIAVGGGSVIDAAKAIAALLTNPGALHDYLEVIGRGLPIRARSAPVIAVPTTAGTGAEVTRNAVLADESARVKVSMRSPLMIPTIALVDPELTYDLPPELTATTGLDALTQCIEPFVSPQANPVTDAVAREGIRRAAGSLRRAFHDGGDSDARRDMAVASLCGGLALANAKLGAVHGFAVPLGGRFPIAHGAVCARLLPLVADANVRALRERQPAALALSRYREVAQLVTGRPDARAEDAVEWLARLVDELRIPRLGNHVAAADVAAVVDQARRASSMQGNPVELTSDELGSVLARAL